MGTGSTRNDHSSVVVRIFRGDMCMGTGFFVRPDHVLTCFHVIDGETDKPLRLKLVGDTFQTGVVEATSEAHDLALIRIPCPQAAAPVCFLIGLKTQYENVLRNLNWQAIGYDLRDSDTFLSAASAGREPAFQWDNKTGTLLDVQVNLGLPAGFSGGPVFIETQGKTLCLGISTLGGMDRDKSRIRLADCIVGFLEESGVEAASLDAYDVFPREIAPKLARPRPTIHDERKPGRFWMWAAALGLASAVCVGLYFYVKPAVVTPDPSYKVQILLASSTIPPKLLINRELRAPESYDGQNAIFRMRRGKYQIEADYPDKTCAAEVTVTGDLSTKADCKTKPQPPKQGPARQDQAAAKPVNNAEKPAEPVTGDNAARGIELANHGRCTEAVAPLTQASLTDPTNTEVFYQLGRCQNQERKFDAALVSLKSAIETNPRRADIFVQRAMSFSGMKNLAAAKTDLDQALTLDPGNLAAVELRGDIFMLRGNYREAVDAFYEVYQQKPNRSRCAKLAEAYRKNGVPDSADTLERACGSLP